MQQGLEAKGDISMPDMTGGEALVQSLIRHGVKVIFGLPGVQIMDTMDALFKQTDIRFITTRNEQATTYMADGYARASGNPGVALVVPGPGIMNASAGLGTAFAASSPVLLIAGQINTEFIGKSRGVLHEVEDQLSIVRSVTKWDANINDPQEIPNAIHEAFTHLQTGRPRPVAIDIPPETMAEIANIELREPGNYAPLAVDQDAVAEAAQVLTSAKNPVIWAGGGVISSEATDALEEVANHLQAPVLTTPEGKGAVSARHPMFLGTARGAMDQLTDVLKDSDVILAVGTRFATANPEDGQKVVQIDIDESEIGRNHQNTIGVVGDARTALEELHKKLQSLGAPKEKREDEIATRRQEREDILRQTEPQASIVKSIREVMPEDGITVEDMTQIGYFSHVYYPVYQPRTYLTSSYFGTLGYAFSTALGVKVAKPDTAVVAICGDGGFMFQVQELATAVQHNINLVTLVFNDGAYGNVLRDQHTRFEKRAIGSELQNPDFAKLAESFGADGMKLKGPSEVGPALNEALSNNKPTLIEVPVKMMPAPVTNR